MSLFPTTQQKHLVEFKAGKCARDGGLLKPDTRKGLIYIDQDDSELIHFYWKERKAGSTVEDDLIIFPREASFVHVEQCTTGRVYQLKFTTSNQRLFFWMQAKSSDKDQEIVNKVNRLFTEPHLVIQEERAESGGIDLGAGGMDMNMNQAELLQYLQSVGGHGGTIPTLSPAAGNGPISQPNLPDTTTPIGNLRGSQPIPTTPGVGTDQSSSLQQDQLTRLRNVLASIRVPDDHSSDIDLANVLTPSAIAPLLNDPEIASALFPHLPPTPQPATLQDLRETLQSPQFQQALHSLSIALHSGQLGPLVTQLGLPPEAGQSVEGFLRAIEAQARRRAEGGGNGNGNTDQSGDRMDTD